MQCAAKCNYICHSPRWFIYQCFLFTLVTSRCLCQPPQSRASTRRQPTWAITCFVDARDAQGGGIPSRTALECSHGLAPSVRQFSARQATPRVLSLPGACEEMSKAIRRHFPSVSSRLASLAAILFTFNLAHPRSFLPLMQASIRGQVAQVWFASICRRWHRKSRSHSLQRLPTL